VLGNWVVVGMSLLAALAFALSSSLKHVSAGDMPDAQSLNPGKVARFVRATVSHRLWLAGMVCDVVGVALQILALHLGALSVVQPLLLSSLLFALFIRGRFRRQRVDRKQMCWAAVLTGALAGFLMLATSNATAAHHRAEPNTPLAAGIVGVVLLIGCIALGRQRSAAHGGRNGQTAALMGAAVGIIYAATATLLKATSDIAVRHPADLLISWQLYTAVAVGAAGLLLGQLTFQAGPLTASLPVTATVDPLLSIVIGVVVFHERFRLGVVSGIIFVLLLAVLAIAVVQLGRSSPDVQPDVQPDLDPAEVEPVAHRFGSSVGRVQGR